MKEFQRQKLIKRRQKKLASRGIRPDKSIVGKHINKVVIFDNASAAISYDDRWKSLPLNFSQDNSIFESFIISNVRKAKHIELSNIHAVNSITSELPWLLDNVIDERTLILITNADVSIVHDLHMYRLKYKKYFTLAGIWLDGMFHRDGNKRNRLRSMGNINKHPVKLSENALIKMYDLNLIPSYLDRDSFIRYYQIGRSDLEGVVSIPLPFNIAADSSVALAEEYSHRSIQDQKENTILIQSHPDNGQIDDRLFLAIEQDFPQYDIINAQNVRMLKRSYMNLAIKSKFILTFNAVDVDPYMIYEAMKLGCIPIAPKLPLYSNMFKHHDWFYDPIVLRPPFINFIRNRKEILEKIRNIEENYLSYKDMLLDELEHMTKYYDSVEFIDKLTNSIHYDYDKK